MTVLITLTTLGVDTGPLFNLYSDLDGYTTAFATGVTKTVLAAGYTSSDVPDGTTIIRVLSTGVCTNYIDLNISGLDCGLEATAVVSTPTTTTTTTAGPIRTMYNAGVSDISVGDSCSQFISNPINLYSICVIPVIGCILYVHPFHNLPLLGNSFAYIDGSGTWDVDISTGEILSFSIIQC